MPQPLIRPETFILDYQEWLNSSEYQRSLRTIREIFEAGSFGYGDLRGDIIRTPTYAMLVLHPESGLSTQDFRFLHDVWKDRILGLGYTHYLSDLRINKTDGGLEEHIERHYLKPDVYEDMMHGRPVNRLYGNITLEHFLFNGDTDHFKLTMTFYHEHGIKKEKSLEELMEKLLRI